MASLRSCALMGAGEPGALVSPPKHAPRLLGEHSSLW
jgi:hypothetical protein